jgi:glycerol-3-phosphate acyltransferase PlsY
MGEFSTGRWVFGLIVWVIVFLVPTWRIVSKAGYSGAWALITLVPIVNLIALWVFAFVRWPYERSHA